MENTSQLIDTIGADRLREALDVTATRIRQARHDDKLPASWFDLCERLTGQTLPRKLFAFKGEGT